MDEHLDELRRLRADLVARSERLRLWSRLAGARMDLLVAQVCPPASADEVADDDVAELADLVLGTGPAAAVPGGDRVAALRALRAARRDLARRREHVEDLVCWSTAQLLLEGSAHGAPDLPRRAAAGPALVTVEPAIPAGASPGARSRGARSPGARSRGVPVQRRPSPRAALRAVASASPDAACETPG